MPDRLPETIPAAPTGVSRRAVLRASAWSVPVVAVAVATPVTAASVVPGAIDLELTARPGGTRLIVTNPEGTRTLDLTVPFTFDATTRGAIATAGSTLVLSFDVRLLDDLSVALEGEPAERLTSEITGNTRTETYALPGVIPGDGAQVAIQPFFGTVVTSTFVPDAEPYVVTLIAPTGVSETDLSNNTVTLTPEYVDPPV